jgi:hypothetical protein
MGLDAGGLTIVEALTELEAHGYVGQFVVRKAGTLDCSACGQQRPAEDVRLEEEQRIEGESDPADEAVVAGLRCPCGAKGTIVFTYGSAGSPEEEETFRRLTDSRAGAAGGGPKLL